MQSAVVADWRLLDAGVLWPAMRAILLCLCLALLPAPSVAKPLTCSDPVTGDPVKVKVGKVKRALKAVRKRMKRFGVHVLDLPAEAQDRRRRLDEDLAEKDWCVVRSHVIAFEDALAMMAINDAFVSAKFGRVERWVRDSGDRAPESVQRLLANAAAQLAEGKLDKANGVLNKAIGQLFGGRDLWRLPASLPQAPAEVSAGDGRVEIAPYEVADGCPALAKRGRANRSEYKDTMKRLGRLMDTRRFRAIDLKGGDQLLVDLASYEKLGAVWPATRVACAMLARFGELEVGLGVVMKRFQLVETTHRAKPLPEEKQERFRELVRSASDQMAARNFDAAHVSLEELLVMLGRPNKPSRGLP